MMHEQEMIKLKYVAYTTFLKKVCIPGVFGTLEYMFLSTQQFQHIIRAHKLYVWQIEQKVKHFS